MIKKDIDDEIDRLLDDNHLCIRIMEENCDDPESFLEAKERLSINRLRIAELTDMKDQMSEDI